MRALRQVEVLALPRGRAALRQAGPALRARHSPLPFDAKDGLRIPTAFHVDPSVGVFLNEDTELPASAWFSDVIFFRLPGSLHLFGERLHLAFVDVNDEPLVEVVFRVEEDSQLNRTAFRRARKARAREDKRARKAARKEAEQEALEAASSR